MLAGWGDWLGTGRIANKTRSIVHSRKPGVCTFLGLQGRVSEAWARVRTVPMIFPAFPEGVYKDEGWAGWGDWLGTFNRWNRNAVLSFLYSIKPVLQDLEPAELFAIMRQNGLIAAIRNTSNSNTQLIKDIRGLCSSPNPEVDFEDSLLKLKHRNEKLA